MDRVSDSGLCQKNGISPSWVWICLFLWLFPIYNFQALSRKIVKTSVKNSAPTAWARCLHFTVYQNCLKFALQRFIFGNKVAWARRRRYIRSVVVLIPTNSTPLFNRPQALSLFCRVTGQDRYLGRGGIEESFGSCSRP